MAQLTCSQIKDLVVSSLGQNTEVTSVRGTCIVTLPLKTIDDRYPDVFIDRVGEDSYRIHDAGITTSQLFSQGVHLTELKTAALVDMAERLGIFFSNGVFQTLVKADGIEASVFAISQCTSIGMFELLSHKPIVEEEPMSGRVKRVLSEWRPDYIKSIEQRVPVPGRTANHVFDFVSFPKEPRNNIVAIKILRPSYSPQAQAERYGYLSLDIEGTIANDWKKMAIITKVEQWSKTPLDIVERFSAEVLQLRSGEDEVIDNFLPAKMRRLSEAA